MTQKRQKPRGYGAFAYGMTRWLVSCDTALSGDGGNRTLPSSRLVIGLSSTYVDKKRGQKRGRLEFLAHFRPVDVAVCVRIDSLLGRRELGPVSYTHLTLPTTSRV